MGVAAVYPGAASVTALNTTYPAKVVGTPPQWTGSLDTTYTETWTSKHAAVAAGAEQTDTATALLEPLVLDEGATVDVVNFFMRYATLNSVAVPADSFRATVVIKDSLGTAFVTLQSVTTGGPTIPVQNGGPYNLVLPITAADMSGGVSFANLVTKLKASGNRIEITRVNSPSITVDHDLGMQVQELYLSASYHLAGDYQATAGTKVIKYTVTSTDTSVPTSVSPSGPAGSPHFGAFALGNQANVSAMANLAPEVGQKFMVQPVAQFLVWNGVSFSNSGTTVAMGPMLTLDGIASPETWTHFTGQAPIGLTATHWQLGFAVYALGSTLAVPIAPAINTTLYLDSVMVSDNGLPLDNVLYLDGSRPRAAWEGTAHDSTSIYTNVSTTTPDVPEPLPDPGDPSDPDAPPTDPGDSGTEPPILPPVTPDPPKPVVPPGPDWIAGDLIGSPQTGGLCLDGDIQLADLVLNTIDNDGTLWIATDVEGWWTLPEPDIPDFTRGMDDGSYDATGRYNARVFTLTGSFWPTSYQNTRISRDRLIRAANLCHKIAWFATHELDATRASRVVLSGQPLITTVQVNGRTDFSIGLKAFDPIKYGLKDRLLPGLYSIQITSTTSFDDQGTRTYDRTYDWRYPADTGGSTLPAEAHPTNDGNTRVYPTLRLHGKTNGPVRIVNATTGQTMRVVKPLYDQEELVINCMDKTVSLNGAANQRFYLEVVTDWIYLDPGVNRIYFIEEATKAGATLTVEWRPGWIG
jgi:hypothetical protein